MIKSGLGEIIGKLLKHNSTHISNAEKVKDFMVQQLDEEDKLKELQSKQENLVPAEKVETGPKVTNQEGVDMSNSVGRRWKFPLLGKRWKFRQKLIW